MGMFDSIREKIRESFEQKKKDRLRMEELRKEAELERRKIFEQQFKIDAIEVAKSKSKEDAAKLSGLQKLRAGTRLRRLNDSSNAPPPGSFFEKMRDYTSKNIARREENLVRTKNARDDAEKMKAEREAKKGLQRQSSMARLGSRGFGNSTWKM